MSEETPDAERVDALTERVDAVDEVPKHPTFDEKSLASQLRHYVAGHKVEGEAADVVLAVEEAGLQLVPADHALPEHLLVEMGKEVVLDAEDPEPPPTLYRLGVAGYPDVYALRQPGKQPGWVRWRVHLALPVEHAAAPAVGRHLGWVDRRDVGGGHVSGAGRVQWFAADPTYRDPTGTDRKRYASITAAMASLVTHAGEHR